MRGFSAVAGFLALALFSPTTVRAQEEPSPPQQQAQTPAVSQQAWSADQLDNLVAPIALYPDPLLSQVLVASTYPLEVVEASQWLQRNRDLQGQALIDAAKQQPWDPSVQALVAVPDALAKLNQDIRWTTDLGNAFLAQQADVMSAVQRMRARAEADGHLSSTPQQTVATEAQGGQQVIVIQPANPQVIYVPTYDPYYIWGAPLWGYYPPLYYPAFGFGFGPGFNLSFCFGGWSGWLGWGWYPNWFGHTVYVNNYFFHHYGYHYGYHGGYHGGIHGRTVWAHNQSHRMNIPYGNRQVAARYGQAATPRGGSYRSGTTTRNAAYPYAQRSVTSSASRNAQQRYSSTTAQGQRYQNPERQRYQTTQQYRNSMEPYRAESQTQRLQNQPQRQQSSRQYSSAPQVQRYQGQSQQRYQAPEQSRYSSPQYRAEPQMQQFQNRLRSYGNGAASLFRSAPQTQRFQSQAPQRFVAPQQFRAAPRMSTPAFNGSGFNRGGFGGFSRGSGGGFSQGSSGGFSRAGGGLSRGGGGGNHRR
jgi:uncharacterized membrane protein YgcG